MKKNRPPALAHWFLLKFLRDDLVEDVEGDLQETYDEAIRDRSLARARFIYWSEVFNYLRPFAFKKLRFSKSHGMYQSYFRSAFRNLSKSKFLSAINIAGLSLGMAVFLAIGLWIWDEISFDRYAKDHARIARVIQNVTNNGEVQTWISAPWPLADEIRKNYGSDFEDVVLTTPFNSHLLTTETKKLTMNGGMVEPGFEKLFSLHLTKGKPNLSDPSSIMLSESAAKAYFGDTEPLNQILRLDDQYTVNVTGIFKDLPVNSTFGNAQFVASWEMLHNSPDIKGMDDPWRPNAFLLYVSLNDNATFAGASEKIRDAKLRRVNEMLARKKPMLFLHPMDQWHLYSEFHNGKITGGRITYVWLFGAIAVFVLLMACINFMNLTTARSEQRAKEVGIRKTVGSLRGQLILQFFCESTMITFFSLIAAIIVVQLSLPVFNQITDKHMLVPFTQPVFWGLAFGSTILIGLICGSYPALYLSSIQPGKALKGTYRASRSAGISRKSLVVVQFSISVILVVGTVTVFQQVRYAQNRPIGYDRTALVTSPVVGGNIHKHFNAFRDELLKSNAVVAVAESGAAPTQGEGSTSGIDWNGKDPNLSTDFSTYGGSADYGKTVGWEIKQGRDFSEEIISDSSAVLLNEAAVAYMGLKDPVGETIRWWGESQKVIGVLKNIIVNSPYEQSRPSVYYMRRGLGNTIIMKINPERSATEALSRIESIFRQYNPDEPFSYTFTDVDFAAKFGNEARVGKLAAIFTILAVIISCLGIFALSSFEAEQRTKEIGIRKVMGASVFSLWKMLSGNFVILVIISCIVAVPAAYFSLHAWLQNFSYRTSFPWWAFAVASVATLLITLLTVSYHTLHAAHSKPASSLRSE